MHQQALKRQHPKLMRFHLRAALGAGVERFWQLVGTTVRHTCGCGLCGPSEQHLVASLCVDSRCELQLSFLGKLYLNFLVPQDMCRLSVSSAFGRINMNILAGPGV